MMITDTKLGAFIRRYGGVIQTGPFGSQLHQSDYREIGTPVIMPKDIINDRVDTSSIAKVDDVTIRKLSRHILQDGDIVYPRRGDLNKRAYITEKEAGWLCGTGCMKISIQGTPIYPKYLFFFLKHPDIVRFIENKAVGATMPNLSSSLLADVDISYPPFEQQQRIASILSAYDDLIENNNRRIALLEESMRLLYREWFVRLRFPGYEHVRVVDGLPEGWEKKPLKTIADVNEKNINSQNPPTEIEYIDISSVSTGSIDKKTIVLFDRAPSRAQRIVQNDDIIWSTVRPNRRSYAFVISPRENTVVSTGFAVLSAKKVPATFLYLSTTTDDFVNHLASVATGAAYPAVKPKDFEDSELLIPSKKLLNQFNDFAYPAFKQINNLRLLNINLSEARDLLLPRLMSGELAV